MVRDQSRPYPPLDSGWVCRQPPQNHSLTYAATLAQIPFPSPELKIRRHTGCLTRRCLSQKTQAQTPIFTVSAAARNSLLQLNHSKLSLMPRWFLFPPERQWTILPNPSTTRSTYLGKCHHLPTYRPSYATQVQISVTLVLSAARSCLFQTARLKPCANESDTSSSSAPHLTLLVTIPSLPPAPDREPQSTPSVREWDASGQWSKKCEYDYGTES